MLQAHELFKKALEQYPAEWKERRANTMNNIGLILLQLGRFAEAQTIMEEVIKVCNTSQSANQ